MREIAYHHNDIYAPIKDTVAEEYEHYKKMNDFIVRPPRKDAE